MRAAADEALLSSHQALHAARGLYSAKHGEETPLDLAAIGHASGVAPSAALCAKLQGLVGGVSSLDASSSDVQALVESLSSLHTTAERSVWRVRRLDEQRRLLQAALERVEDLLDLRACLAGLAAAQASGDRAAIALNVSRFRALARTLPMPEGDVATVQASEGALLAAVTADFDAAIAEQQALSSTQGSAPDYASQRAATEATIATCCQLLSLLGKGFVGVERYAAYLRATLSSDIMAELRKTALTGVDYPCAALNAASALFAKAADTLSNANVLGGSLFDSSGSSSGAAAEGGQAASAATTSPAAAASTSALVVHSVLDGAAARVILSATRSGRVAAALAARESLRTGLGSRASSSSAAAKAAAAAAASARAAAQAGSSSSGGAGGGGPPPLPPHLADSFLRALQQAQPPSDTPFALPPLPEGPRPTWEPTGEDFTDCTTLDMFLDEQALLLQRCASYWRLVTAGHLAACGSGGHAGALAALHAHGRLAVASSELVGVYSALEAAGSLAGIARAVAMDEVLEEGAAAVGVDLMDAGLPVGVHAGLSAAAVALAASSSSSSSSSSSGSGSAEPLPHMCGAGAMVSTLVEDVFFVLLRAGRRAFATGSADAAAAVVNNAIVMPLMDRLGNELDVRFRSALGLDGGDGSDAGGGAGSSSSSSSVGGAGFGSLVPPGAGSSVTGLGLASPTAQPLTPEQWERLAQARRGLMATPAVRASSARIGEFQSLASPGVGGGGGGGGGGGALTGAGTAAGAFVSPARHGLALGGRHGSGGGSGSSSSEAAATSTLGTEPVAKLTEEAAAACLALNITQLAAECTVRLKASLEAEAGAVFSAEEGRELTKVKASLTGLADCAHSFRRALDAGLATLAARLGPRLRSACNLFDGASSLVQYELSEGAYAAACGGAHAFATEFLPVLAAMLAPYQYALTPSLARALLLRVAGHTGKQLESRLKRKRFNLLGALQYEADARALVAFFTARAGREARDRLLKLLAMARILTCESAGEAEERYKGGGAELGALSREEVAAILKQRVDFK